MSLSDVGNIANLDNDPADNVDFNDLDLLIDKWLKQEILMVEDLNRDGIVNFVDYAIFANHWLEGTIPIIAGDFNGDGRVDIGDLEMLARWWLLNKTEVDIAPPGGDGIVNFLDYAVFAANWLEGL